MQPLRNMNINISNKTIVRVIIWIFVAIMAYRFMGRVAHALTLIFAAFFLALALNPAVGWISRHLKIKSRVRATAVAYLTAIVILAAFFALITPPLVRQTRDFVNDVPNIVQSFQSQDTGLARTVHRYHLDTKLTQGARDFASHYSNFGSTILDTGKRIAEAVVSILVVLVLTFMMLVEGPQWLELLWGNLSEKKRGRYQKVANRMYRSVTAFVNGQVILAAVAASFALVALEIASQVLDVSINAIALAGIVAVFGIIPLFGNPIAAAIVILVCLLNSGSLALVMLIYFIIYFFVENHTFQPYLQSRLNELTPLTVLIAAILGVGFGGFLGAIIAIPAASTVKILLEDHFEHRRKLPHPEAAYDD
ncbi:MAG TPA: AI-2E family transporter [Candidatus Saccharimonadales bacterium]|nr:AI-2E family transporter [Candidatus Saccharimonadales bacterium]